MMGPSRGRMLPLHQRMRSTYCRSRSRKNVVDGAPWRRKSWGVLRWAAILCVLLIAGSWDALLRPLSRFACHVSSCVFGNCGASWKRLDAATGTSVEIEHRGKPLVLFAQAEAVTGQPEAFSDQDSESQYTREPPTWVIAHTAIYHLDRLWANAVRALWPFRDVGEADGVYILYQTFLGYLRCLVALADTEGNLDQTLRRQRDALVAAAARASEEGVGGSGSSAEGNSPALHVTLDPSSRLASSSGFLLALLSHKGDIGIGSKMLVDLVSRIESLVSDLTAAPLDIMQFHQDAASTALNSSSIPSGEVVAGTGGSENHPSNIANRTSQLLWSAVFDAAIGGEDSPPSSFPKTFQATSIQERLQSFLEHAQGVLNYFLMQVFAKRGTTQGTVLGWSRSLLNPGRPLADAHRLAFFATFLRSELRVPALYNPVLAECHVDKLSPQAAPAFDVIRFLREQIGDHKLSHQFIAIRPEAMDEDEEIGQIVKQALRDYFGPEELQSALTMD
ncbi:unnamed protein product, partial [Amoebophrya sp. A25]|eukprot:GSA25T00012032001.1